MYATILPSSSLYAREQQKQELNLIQQISNINDDENVCQIWSQIKGHHKQKNNTNLNHTCYLDTQYYDTTMIITGYSLVCEREYSAVLTQATHIGGGSIYDLFGGIFGDKYGHSNSTPRFQFLLTVFYYTVGRPNFTPCPQLTVPYHCVFRVPF